MSLWLATEPAVLASQSGVRRAILLAAGIPVEVLPADLDERALERRFGPNISAPEAASALALAKAQAVAARLRGRLVVGADQTLALGDRRFAKPPDLEAARRQLIELRGRTHALHSALAVVRDGVTRFAHVATARLTLRGFSDEFLQRYLAAASEQVTTSVGAYQIEGLGSQLFERIDGDHFAVLGLPLLPLLAYLRRDGYLLP